MDCVVSPVDQTFPSKNEEVSVTELPEQNVVGPLAVMVGVPGIGFAVTLITLEFAEVQGPSTTFT